MRTTAKITLIASIASALFVALAASPATADSMEQTSIAEGKQIAFDKAKGNCLACHDIAGGEMAGNIGPALVGIKDRYPDKDKLRAQIFDASRNNPNTIMPPFGRHAILTNDELNKVVEFIYTL